MRFRFSPRSFAPLLLCVLTAGCAETTHASFERDLHARVQHVVIIVQENRSFDNLFNGFPGADTATSGVAHDGTRVPLRPVSLKVGYDLSNGFRDFQTSYDGGRMDGWDLRRVVPTKGSAIPLSVAEYPQFARVPRSEVKPYWDLASQYGLADRMFQSNIDQSFAAHLYLIAGQAGRATNVPSGRPWGCDAYEGTSVLTLSPAREVAKAVFPCFNFKTIADEVAQRGLTWRYYAPQLASPEVWERFAKSRTDLTEAAGPDFGQLWTSYDAIAHMRYGSSWLQNIVSPPSTILKDVRDGKLANVTWVVPDWKDSDHSYSRSDTGPSWVASIVNAVGGSAYWRSTIVLVVWDDSGGWYDHVPPPQLDFDGLGVRVPLVVISPYSKRGFVSHTQYEFGSILRLVEATFGLSTLAASDARANDLVDFFDFSMPARPFMKIEAKYPRTYFLHEPPSHVPPDND